MAHQAQETFTAELSTGPLLVQKGAVFSSAHEVVKLDDDRGLLFKPLDVDEKPAQPPRRAAKGA